MFAKKHDTKEKISGLMLTYPINNRTFGVTKQIHSSMEQLLHYIWKHKMFPLHPLQTTAGEPVEVIDPGLHNIHAGPDFFNAKIKIGCTMWVGNVEIHERATDWFGHGHDHDPHYNNVILHVCAHVDGEVTTADGKRPPQMQLDVPPQVEAHYEELCKTDSYPPCYKVIPSLDRLTVHSWMAALQAERLEQKTRAIEERVDRCDGSWEAAYFVTMARNFGFGVNSEAFEQWAFSIPLHCVDHHRDNLFQIEAIFMGQAGLLNEATIPTHCLEDAMREGYFSKLRTEYQYLQHKFSLTPIDPVIWRFLRLRPQNFPHIRISQLAHLYHQRKASLSALAECKTVDDALQLFDTQVTPYWETHYTFGSTSTKSGKHLSPSSVNLLMINTLVPMLFAYGKHRMNEELCDRAFGLLEQLKAENDNIVRMWRTCGLPVVNAGDTQALIQLKKNYCDRRDCLRCRFGYEYLKGRRIEE